MSTSDNVQEILDALLSDDATLRLQAINNLKSWDDVRHKDKVYQALFNVIVNGSHLDTKERAASVFLWIKDERVIENLLDLAKASEVRLIAVRALGNYEDPDAIKILKRALKDSDSKIRDSAIQAFSDNRSTEAVEPLLELIRTTSPLEDTLNLRPAAIRVLGLIGDQRAVEFLESLYHRADLETQQAIEQALQEIEGKS